MKRAPLASGTIDDLDPAQLEKRIVFDVFIDNAKPHESA